MAVTVGFVAGSFLSALTNVSEIYPARIVFAVCAFFGAAATALITVSGGYTPALILRFLTGFALAGVYPVGMKMMATWLKEDRGLGLGLLTGGLIIGTASPHLIRALGGTDNWQFALYVAAALAALGGIIVLWVGELGPVFGIWAMRSLKQSSAAARLAGGRG
jgi:MFS family permease